MCQNLFWLLERACFWIHLVLCIYVGYHIRTGSFCKSGVSLEYAQEKCYCKLLVLIYMVFLHLNQRIWSYYIGWCGVDPKSTTLFRMHRNSWILLLSFYKYKINKSINLNWQCIRWMFLLIYEGPHWIKRPQQLV